MKRMKRPMIKTNSHTAEGGRTKNKKIRTRSGICLGESVPIDGKRGVRIRQGKNEDVYDSLSSGAGYAVSLSENAEELLQKTEVLLSGCTCGSACHKCLKHYRNQYLHGRLDRFAARDPDGGRQRLLAGQHAPENSDQT